MERKSATKVQKTAHRVSHLHAQSGRSRSSAHAFLGLQRSIGNQAVQRLINSPYIQTKLQVSTPEDPLEQEADRTADTVMRMQEPTVSRDTAAHITPLVQRERAKPEDEEETMVSRKSHGVPLAVREDDDEEETVQRACKDCEEETVNRKETDDEEEVVSRSAVTPRAAAPASANIRAMQGGGSPLPPPTRAFFEPRFGADFSHVRVHTDQRAADTAKSLNARAFTVGRDIAFGAGQNSFESQDGRRLLAHELTHVVQQSGNGTSAVAGRRISRAEASVQRDLLDDFTDELTTVSENVVAGVEEAASAVAKGVETAGSELASGVEAAGSALASGAEGLGAAVKSGAQAVASAASAGGKTVAETVDSAKEQAAAIAGMANENTEEALEFLDWRNLQINWESEQGKTVRAWAARLDPEIVRRVRSISPSALLSVVSVPDEIRQAAGELAKQSRAEFKPGLIPGLDPGLIPGLEPKVPTRPPTPPGLPPIKVPIVIIVIIIILAILLTPTNIFDDKEFENKELEKGREEDRKRRAEEQKEKNEKEKGRCRETIPALKAQIHIKTIQELDQNANDFINERFKGKNNADDLGFFFNKEAFNFFLSVSGRTKNTILKVCSVPNNTLATSSGNKHIADKLHAEELAAPLLITQLQSVPEVEREGAILFNVCQSRACVKEVVTNPEGCTAVLEGIRDRFLPGGQVVDEPTGFPPAAILIPKSAEALLRQLRRRIRN